MKINRFITTNNEDRKSIIKSHKIIEVGESYRYSPGFSVDLLWLATFDETPESVNNLGHEKIASVLPRSGGRSVMIVTFPPKVKGDTGLGSVASSEVEKELREKLPGLAELFEEEEGFHRTKTIDFAMVLEGKILLKLDDGLEQMLDKNDCVVQFGVRHAWENRWDLPARIVFFMRGI